MIECKYCGKFFKSITNTHLKKHNKSIDDHIKDFPGINLFSKESLKKMQETCVLKYGVSHTSKLASVKEKKRNTYRENLGVDSPLQNSKILEKKEKTCKERFGFESVMKNSKIKEKHKQTCLVNLGVSSPMKNSYIKQKHEETCNLKYGYKNIFERPDIIEKVKKRHIDSFLPNLRRYLEIFDLTLLDPPYMNCYHLHSWKCNKCGKEFKQIWNSIQQGFLCPGCFPRQPGKSLQEEELKKFIKELGFITIDNDRNIISPYELDIVIPEKNIAIEYCGLYWHSYEKLLEYNKTKEPKKYHLNKLNRCIEIGYNLITIFEDEWLLKKEITKNKLKYILGKNNLIKINGRHCIIKEIDSKTKNNFLNSNHIQSSDSSVIKLGAFYKDELVSVMTFSHGNISKGSRAKDKIWELNRFCVRNDCYVIGIASKLLTYFKRNYDWEEIFSYADRRWSSGKLYEKLGFDLVSYTYPNYWYIEGLNRLHRFNLRKKERDPSYISETILRRSEGYLKIFDCGNLKFVLKKEK